MSSQELVQKCPCIPGSNWNLEMLFLRRGETGVPGEKPVEQSREPKTNSTHHDMTPGPGIEPGTHWWEASALTIAPSLFLSLSGLTES